MSLEDRIISLDLLDEHLEPWSSGREGYLAGFAAGRYRSATIAAEADELMAEMADILWSASIGCAVNNKAADAVEKYNNWKERTR